ncbi:NlpC/P60 family protein [Pseudohoeflea coraliihabitans]|uniref:C40 family peptidase n=1 Tax=Pseudohoeflea coraliihabitans TaxID=2860393 RepID=A0ABS6WUD9_9HYPH|nr:NlpC/P60 family protein [Pseudohoeflea sp. DP4N28-3]MBW3098670.1 C40 family peptidase [Pseudohoeflea sp. DP4N28-3]
MTAGRLSCDDAVACGAAIVALARQWIGTPYRHQASHKGVGADCLGLVRGVFTEATGRIIPLPAPYARDWAERCHEERLLDAARHYCGAPLPCGAALPGDIVIFRWQAGSAAKHAGILSPARRFIHAYEPAGVIESPLTPSWARRIVGTFRIARTRD